MFRTEPRLQSKAVASLALPYTACRRTGRRNVRVALACLVVFAAHGTTAGIVSAADNAEFEVLRGETYVERGDEELQADVYLPKVEGPVPGVLVVHGGAWMSGTRNQLSGIAAKLARRGMTAVAISYRLAPAAKFPAQIEDCQDAVRWMRRNAERLKIDPQRIGAFGYSAGGHLVSLLGVMDDTEPQPSTRLAAVAAGGAPYDFREMPEDNQVLAYFLGGSRREKPEAYRLASPAAFVTKDDPPLFIFHGQRDRLVPVTNARKMAELVREQKVPTQLNVVAGQGHVGTLFNAKAHTAAIDFLAEHLEAKPPAAE